MWRIKAYASLYSRSRSLILHSAPAACSSSSSHSAIRDAFIQSPFYNTVSDTYIVKSCQSGFEQLHEFTGLPWWATIITATVLARATITLPLAAHQNYIFAKLENIGPEMNKIAKDLGQETALAKKSFDLTDKQCSILFKKSMKKQWQKLVIRENCHPFKGTLLILVQIPLWISMSFSIRNLAYMLPEHSTTALVTYEQFLTGGFGWISDLTMPDHTFILPITFGVLNLAIIELQAMSRSGIPSRVQKYTMNIFRGISIIMVPIAASVPSSLCLYWVTSSSFGLFQNILLLSPKARRFLRIPLTPTELKEPYQIIKTKIVDRVPNILKRNSL
ncbi:cytochrome c oxidase assembly protein COX18, mitochondrial [Arctopsyche grandis]|uniref:cytochrome c oxidase assembly protein COX18, mitochondrial n=1 Tax=Arctopsyche grandis TaxID=121162 RepID=UPI00406D6815